MKSKIAFFALVIIACFNTVVASDVFQGSYSQKTAIIRGDAPEEASNFLTISKVLDAKGVYYVTISIVGGYLHTCDFNDEMKLKGNVLSYYSKDDDCSVRIMKTRGGVQVKSNKCEQHCGMGVRLEGTGQGFLKENDGDSIMRSQEGT